VYLQAAVCHGAVHGELPSALPDAPLHHLTIAGHISHLHPREASLVHSVVMGAHEAAGAESAGGVPEAWLNSLWYERQIVH